MKNVRSNRFSGPGSGFSRYYEPIFKGVRLSLRHDPDNENLLSTGQETLRYAQV
jgi:hypothetical protein